MTETVEGDPVAVGDASDGVTYNPVVEALAALRGLERLAEQDLNVQARVQLHAAQAIGWSLLASVTGGDSIKVQTPRAETGGVQEAPLEKVAKAAFGG